MAALVTENMAVVAPIPRARVARATKVKPGVRRRARKA